MELPYGSMPLSINIELPHPYLNNPQLTKLLVETIGEDMVTVRIVGTKMIVEPHRAEVLPAIAEAIEAFVVANL